MFMAFDVNYSKQKAFEFTRDEVTLNLGRVGEWWLFEISNDSSCCWSFECFTDFYVKMIQIDYYVKMIQTENLEKIIHVIYWQTPS